MLLHGSAQHREEFDALMADSALAAIVQDAPLMQIEAALRSLGEMMAKADPLRRAIVREETIRRLRGAGVRSPAAMADTAFGPLENVGHRSSHGKNTGATEEWTNTSWPQGMPSLSQPIASSRRSRERARTRTPN